MGFGPLWGKAGLVRYEGSLLKETGRKGDPAWFSPPLWLETTRGQDQYRQEDSSRLQPPARDQSTQPHLVSGEGTTNNSEAKVIPKGQDPILGSRLLSAAAMVPELGKHPLTTWAQSKSLLLRHLLHLES